MLLIIFLVFFYRCIYTHFYISLKQKYRTPKSFTEGPNWPKHFGFEPKLKQIPILKLATMHKSLFLFILTILGCFCITFIYSIVHFLTWIWFKWKYSLVHRTSGPCVMYLKLGLASGGMRRCAVHGCMFSCFMI